MLERYRVVDLTDERGNLAAFMLAGLGAEVVLVEPPDGSAARRRGPFAGGRTGPGEVVDLLGVEPREAQRGARPLGVGGSGRARPPLRWMPTW